MKPQNVYIVSKFWPISYPSAVDGVRKKGNFDGIVRDCFVATNLLHKTGLPHVT